MRPVATSLLAELFDKRSLGLANGIFSWGIYIGYVSIELMPCASD